MFHLTGLSRVPVKAADPKAMLPGCYLSLLPLMLFVGLFWMRLLIEYLVVYTVQLIIIGQINSVAVSVNCFL